MIYAISVSRIIEVVYALSAIRAAGTDKPPIIGERQEKALRRLTYHCMCRLLPQLAGVVTLAEEPEEPAEVELIFLEGQVSNGEPLGSTLRVYLENTLTAAVMASVWDGTDATVSAAYTAVVESNISSIKSQYTKWDHRIRPSL